VCHSYYFDFSVIVYITVLPLLLFPLSKFLFTYAILQQRQPKQNALIPNITKQQNAHLQFNTLPNIAVVPER
jgi:hypothetical protein